MNFIKINGSVMAFGNTRELRIPIEEVRWWGESSTGTYETEIRLSNDDVIRTHIPINKLDGIMEEALEKKVKNNA